ncbi:hypothetical protein NLC26_03075 [Candidatus Aminicenantes bacterium AC-708-M15]|jgi:ubiquinone/menaquinone biosynthesis C-methylase UbiE|nr:hypothetical protein [SCandidatus Aminicenantes bacterium Aminicenantia_JdfR_composite]MCP2598823.1 hypothetical protein [Candidatus Aminicenantes bacterium AC-335-L06]MCP2604446.1 hypothetical protein [Candidatus Aminicenantes bacterium AC-708-M15]MCP2619140.1 hypothetical protein [Candidatus Aminicenantes bacterium AC-335-A11]MCP2621226.1 hypothetical protein [Candidatus Aminicenantes bacterium AC-334-E05]
MLLNQLARKKLFTTNIYTTKVLEKYIENLKKRKNVKVLNLGYVCGKNIEFLSNQGFTVYVEDYLGSLTPQKIKSSSKGKKIEYIYEFKNFSYPPNFFDGTICWDLFDYLDFEYGMKFINEIERITKEKGFLFCLFDTKKPEIKSLTRKKIIIHDINHLLYEEVKFNRIFYTFYENRDIYKLLKNFKILETFYVKNGVREILAQKII